MSGIKKWGPQTWIFFHMLACKIDESFFKNNRSQCLALIKNICNVLPCPTCTRHAVAFMRRVDVNNVTTKTELGEMLFQFHNLVNKRLGKQERGVEILDTYKHGRFDIALHNFLLGYARKYGNLMAGTVSTQAIRRQVARSVQQWMQRHWRYFQS